MLLPIEKLLVAKLPRHQAVAKVPYVIQGMGKLAKGHTYHLLGKRQTAPRLLPRTMGLLVMP